MANPDDITWRQARRRRLREGGERRPTREARQQEALELLRAGPIVVWPHKCFLAASKVALKDLVREGLASVTIEDILDLAAFQRGEYTVRRCKVYRLKPPRDGAGD